MNNLCVVPPAGHQEPQAIGRVLAIIDNKYP